MPQNDSPLARPGDIAAGFVLLTRLPVRATDAALARGAAAAWAWPVVGAVLGGISGMAALVAMSLGLPAPLAAGLCLGLMAMMTGAMHEDGLADTVDGFWGGWTRERRLEIMKDSHIGSYGVIALILSLGLRWMALSTLFEAGLALPALIAAGALSRAVMPVLMHALPPAREGGLARSVGRVDFDTAVLGAAVAAVMALLALGLTALALVLAVTVAGWGAGALARAKIGGQTGDVLGASQQLAEIAALVLLAALSGA
ncbi:MAG: adenosylcobinamide-GDP ribazoletransferase [Rhodobacterales bacterium]|nr:adenosylcobinamide-GDP ribazoletransferase [Rhodobacterales bacterium]MDX5388952.1 adenosylcobinamide-GDP ribazoletransferase [Rhodobacterales bacterium]MDX5488641.1 adenosylcobinamide-GDP ribazoletransferase [Rhodobacterales bacterium]